MSYHLEPHEANIKIREKIKLVLTAVRGDGSVITDDITDRIDLRDKTDLSNRFRFTKTPGKVNEYTSDVSFVTAGAHTLEVYYTNLMHETQATGLTSTINVAESSSKVSTSSMFLINGSENAVVTFDSKYDYSVAAINLYLKIFDIDGKPILGIEKGLIVKYYKEDVLVDNNIHLSKLSDTEFSASLSLKEPGNYKFKLFKNDEELPVGEPIAKVIDTSIITSHHIYGIFPRLNSGIVDPQNADNAVNINATSGCTPQYYGSQCAPAVDVVALNGLMSEISSVINASGNEYDCARLDNLADAIYKIAYLGDRRRFLIGQTNETSSDSIGSSDVFFPPVVYPQKHLTFSELRRRTLAADKSDEFKKMLNQAKIIDYNFTISGDDKLYFELEANTYLADVLPTLNRDRYLTDKSIAIISIDDKITLYDSNTSAEIVDPTLYSRNNLGTFNTYVEQVLLRTVPIELPTGSHNVKVYVIQFHEPEFPTDIKYRENYTRIRVNKNKPLVQFRVLKSINR